MRNAVTIVLLGFFALVSGSGLAQWDPAAGVHGKKGEGGVVTREGAKVYKESDEDDVARTLKRGSFVVGFTKIFMGMGEYEFMEKDGRFQVAFPVEGSVVLKGGWMNPGDLARFAYDCGCAAECAPVTGNFKQARWNPCFLEAAEAKLDRLRSQWGAAGRSQEGGAPTGNRSTAPAPPSRPASNEKALTNTDVVALVKADLGDELVIAKIEQAPNEALDVSTDAIVSLKQQGVPKAVIQAMIKRAGQRR
jgi:hypothetical protein